MKREQFRVTSNAGHDVIKSKWNAAIRETERLIKETARAEETVYELTDSDSLKVDFGFVSGTREWTRRDGRKVVFTVQKI